MVNVGRGRLLNYPSATMRLTSLALRLVTRFVAVFPTTSHFLSVEVNDSLSPAACGWAGAGAAPSSASPP